MNYDTLLKFKKLVDRELGIYESVASLATLNRRLFPNGEVVVRVCTDQKLRAEASIPPLLPFQAKSFQDFIEIQEQVVNQLEDTLARDQEDSEEPLLDHLFKCIIRLSLELRPRRIASHSALFKAVPGLADRVPKGDTADTCSFFIVEIETKHDEDHRIRLEYRDKMLVGVLRE